MLSECVYLKYAALNFSLRSVSLHIAQIFYFTGQIFIKVFAVCIGTDLCKD